MERPSKQSATSCMQLVLRAKDPVGNLDRFRPHVPVFEGVSSYFFLAADSKFSLSRGRNLRPSVSSNRFQSFVPCALPLVRLGLVGHPKREAKGAGNWPRKGDLPRLLDVPRRWPVVGPSSFCVICSAAASFMKQANPLRGREAQTRSGPSDPCKMYTAHVSHATRAPPSPRIGRAEGTTL